MVDQMVPLYVQTVGHVGNDIAVLCCGLPCIFSRQCRSSEKNSCEWGKLCLKIGWWDWLLQGVLQRHSGERTVNLSWDYLDREWWCWTLAGVGFLVVGLFLWWWVKSFPWDCFWSSSFTCWHWVREGRMDTVDMCVKMSEFNSWLLSRPESYSVLRLKSRGQIIPRLPRACQCSGMDAQWVIA